MKKMTLTTLLFLLAALLATQEAVAQRLKDLTSVGGVRSNQLVGYGLVVGLGGTGDQVTQTPDTLQAYINMLRQFGIQLPPGVSMQPKNIAGVLVNADLPAFAKPGQKLDITVSSIGNAKSLRGGTLQIVPLKGLDDKVYAIAQGNLVVGGFGAEGADGSRITVNVMSVGRIPNGATIERASPNSFGQGDYLVFHLHRSDFTTARRVSERINETFGPDVAAALDGTSIRVRAPRDAAQRVSFLSVLENLEVQPAESAARVVINSRTGTIVIGNRVEVAPAAVTHGSLTVTISEADEVSQPNSFGRGETVVTAQSNVQIDAANNRMFHFAPGPSLQDIVNAVNEVGAAPGDLMAILEALKEAGALRAELVVI